MHVVRILMFTHNPVLVLKLLKAMGYWARIAVDIHGNESIAMSFIYQGLVAVLGGLNPEKCCGSRSISLMHWAISSDVCFACNVQWFGV